MNQLPPGRRSGGSAPRDTVGHRFAVGDKVSLGDTAGTTSTSLQRFRVEAILPARDGALQYRVRSETEGFDRVTTEDMLVAAPGAASASREADRVFSPKPRGADHGQGPDSQQQRGPETQEGQGGQG